MIKKPKFPIKSRVRPKQGLRMQLKPAYSPLSPNDLWGHGGAWGIVSQLISQGQFPPVACITGPAGIGKETFARLIARALLCRESQIAPCGACSICQRSVPESLVVVGDATRETLGIDVIRDIQHESFLKPLAENKTVILISDVERVSEIAWDALLKFFEEPPGYVTVLLTVRDRNILPATVRSRIAFFRLCAVPSSELLARAKAMNIAHPDLQAIIAEAAGRPGLFLKLLARKGSRDHASSGFHFLNNSSSLGRQWQEISSLLEKQKVSGNFHTAIDLMCDQLHGLIIAHTQDARSSINDWRSLRDSGLRLQRVRRLIDRNVAPMSAAFSLIAP